VRQTELIDCGSEDWLMISAYDKRLYS